VEYIPCYSAPGSTVLPATRLASRIILIKQNIKKQTGPALYLLCGHTCVISWGRARKRDGRHVFIATKIISFLLKKLLFVLVNNFIHIAACIAPEAIIYA
jgi:hypothetical protein